MPRMRDIDTLQRGNAYSISNPELIQVADGFNARTKFDESKLDRLAESILEHGVLQPLIVRRDRANEEQPFILIDGERRWRALSTREELLEKLQSEELRIPLTILDVDEDQAEDLMALTFLQKEDLVPTDRANLVARYLQRGITVAEIVQRLGCSKSWVDQMRVLGGSSKAVKSAVDSGKISLTAGLDIARKVPLAKQAKAVERLVSGVKRKQVTGTSARPGKKVLLKVANDLSERDVAGKTMPVADARELVLTAIKFAAGNATEDELMEACSTVMTIASESAEDALQRASGDGDEDDKAGVKNRQIIVNHRKTYQNTTVRSTGDILGNDALGRAMDRIGASNRDECKFFHNETELVLSDEDNLITLRVKKSKGLLSEHLASN